MDKPNSSMAQQIARAASVFEEQRTGLIPKSVTVVHVYLLARSIPADTWNGTVTRNLS